jgi:hypothetical protein
MSFIAGCPYNLGSVVEFAGWPKRDLEPADEDARKIFDYYTARRFEPGMPLTPVDPTTGKIYLPAHLPALRGRWFPSAVAPEDVLPSMPQYKMNSGAPLSYHDRGEIAHGQMFGRRAVAKGETIAFLGWPEPAMALEPANDAARQVVAYLEAHGASGDLPLAPWNLFDGTLFLPKLPYREPQNYAGRHTTPRVRKSSVAYNPYDHA